MAVKKAKQPQPSQPLDTVVVITVLTVNPGRRDEIDRLIDEAFGKDPRVQVVRVVGYPSTDDVATLVGQLADVCEPQPHDALPRD